MYDYDYEKEVEIGKKTKLKSLKRVIDICIKNNIRFEVDEGNITIETSEGKDVVFNFSDFNKNHTITRAIVDYGYDDEVAAEVYYTYKGLDFPVEFAKFFVKFPKLTKAQKKAPPRPPEPEVLATFPASGGLAYDIKHVKHTNNNTTTIIVGCNEISIDEAEDIFKFLGGVLGYDLEE